jgi:hypothetical protein
MACQQWVNKNQWASNVVEQLLHYSQSLWQFCCSLLHGRTLDESHQHHLEQLQSQVKQAYAAYADDPFHVDSLTLCIFLVPIDQRLQQDSDTLHCFLKSYTLACDQQKLLQA